MDVLDITDPASTTLSLDARSVLAMDSTGSGVIVVGSTDDSIVFADGAQWRMAAPLDVAGFSFSVVTIAETFVQVDFVSPWQNLAQPNDVNNDGSVTAGDALRIINELARRAFSNPDTSLLDDPSTVSPWPGVYFDQNGDRSATALDALRVINQLARQANGSPEGESEQGLLAGRREFHGSVLESSISLRETTTERRFSLRESSHLAPPRCSPTECSPSSIGLDRSHGFASAVPGSTSVKSALRSHVFSWDVSRSGFVTAERDGYFIDSQPIRETTEETSDFAEQSTTLILDSVWRTEGSPGDETDGDDPSRVDAAAVDQLLVELLNLPVHWPAHNVWAMTDTPTFTAPPQFACVAIPGNSNAYS
jgi:hypothetical protein